jgi:hypothetical protein
MECGRRKAGRETGSQDFNQRGWGWIPAMARPLFFRLGGAGPRDGRNPIEFRTGVAYGLGSSFAGAACSSHAASYELLLGNDCLLGPHVASFRNLSSCVAYLRGLVNEAMSCIRARWRLVLARRRRRRIWPPPGRRSRAYEAIWPVGRTDRSGTFRDFFPDHAHWPHKIIQSGKRPWYGYELPVALIWSDSWQ